MRLGLATVVWGSTFIVIKLALASVSPVLLVVGRFAAGALCTALIMMLTSTPFRPASVASGPDLARRVMMPSLLLGAALTGGYIFQTLGLLSTGPGKCAFITALYLVFTPVFAWLVNRRRVSGMQAISLLMGLLGVFLLARPEGSLSAGDVFSFAGAVCWAVHLAFIDRYAEEGLERVLTLLQLAFVFLLSMLLFLAIELPQASFDLSTPWPLLGVLYLGVPATALVVLTQMRWQPFLGANAAALIYIGETIVASVGGALVFGERLGLRGYAGCVVILAAVFLVTTVEPRIRRGGR